jgi:hypothetical protein
MSHMGVSRHVRSENLNLLAGSAWLAGWGLAGWLAGWLWLALAGCGWLWLAGWLAGCGWL